MVLIKGFALASLAALVTAKSAVLDLIPSNFDDVVLKSGKPTLVEFFAPWCGHCKNLAPVYEELGLAFEAHKDKVQIAKVDADAEKSLGKRFGVQGFPTLKWFDGKSDKPEEYNSGRDFDSLAAFITEKTGAKAKKAKAPPSDVVMLSDTSFAKEVGGDKNVLVAFTAPWCGHCKSLAPIWETLANDFVSEPDVLIAKVDAEAPNSKATASDQGVTSYPTIKFFPKGNKTPEDYSGGRDEASFIAFLNEKTGTHRAVGGGLNAQAGTIAALDEIVSRYTGGTSLSDAATEIKKAAESMKEQAQYKYAEYYIRVFEKLGKSDTYVAKELARLDGMIKKGGLAPAKLDELTSKTNILRRFVDQVVDAVTPDGKKEEL